MLYIKQHPSNILSSIHEKVEAELKKRVAYSIKNVSNTTNWTILHLHIFSEVQARGVRGKHFFIKLKNITYEICSKWDSFKWYGFLEYFDPLSTYTQVFGHSFPFLLLISVFIISWSLYFVLFVLSQSLLSVSYGQKKYFMQLW